MADSKDPEKQLKTMSLGEHLEELRKRIVRVILVLMCVFAIALPFQNDILLLISAPHMAAMGRLGKITESRLLAEGLEKATRKLGEVPDDIRARAYAEATEFARINEEYNNLISSIDESNVVVTFFSHFNDRLSLLEKHARRGVRYQRIEELVAELDRRAQRLEDLPSESADHLERAVAQLKTLDEDLKSFATTQVGPALTDDWVAIDELIQDLENARTRVRRLEESDVKMIQLKVLRYTDAFFSNIKVCFLVALLVAVPWLVLEIWFFVAAGLYTFERSAVFPFIPFSMGALALGVIFGYTVLVPIGLGYLGSYGSPDVIEPSFTLREYLSLVTTLLLGMGLVFQLPLGMVFATRAGFIDVATLRRSRKICVLGGVVVSAMLTPPDVVTQLLMAGPLLVLFEVGIWCSEYSLKKKKSGKQEATESTEE